MPSLYRSHRSLARCFAATGPAISFSSGAYNDIVTEAWLWTNGGPRYPPEKRELDATELIVFCYGRCSAFPNSGYSSQHPYRSHQPATLKLEQRSAANSNLVRRRPPRPTHGVLPCANHAHITFCAVWRRPACTPKVIVATVYSYCTYRRRMALRCG